MIPRDTIDRIYSAAHIEDVVGQYVSLKKRGANLIGLCPFHSEKTGSFTVSPSKGIYKCFGCGKAGNVVNFIMEIEQCGYPEALKLLAKRYHISSRANILFCFGLVLLLSASVNSTLDAILQPIQDW